MMIKFGVLAAVYGRAASVGRLMGEWEFFAGLIIVCPHERCQEKRPKVRQISGTFTARNSCFCPRSMY